MKRYEKLCSCLMIVALCVAGLALGGCKKAREKKHKMSVATGAVVNSMMTTNPMGALFGKNSNSSAVSEAGVQTMAALIGCPDVELHIDFTPAPYLYKSDITITYAPGCLVNGIAMSGAVNGQWMVSLENLKFYLETELTVDNMTMEGLVTNGYIHQKLHLDKDGPFAQIDGDMTTTHADGRTRSIVYDNLTAEVNLDGLPEAVCQLLGGCDNDTVPSLVINGNAIYTDEDGNTYAMDFDNVTQPFTCPMPTSGTVHLVNTEKEFDAIIDYGDGTCDTLVTITMDGEEPKEVDVTEYVNRRQYRF